MMSELESAQDEFGRTLQLCLELMESGKETVDSLLSLYPSTCETLRSPLEAAAWLYKHSHLFNPHPGFVDFSRHRLVRHVCKERAKSIQIAWLEQQQLIRRVIGESKRAQPSITEIPIAVFIIFNLHPIRTSNPAISIRLLSEKSIEQPGRQPGGAQRDLLTAAYSRT